MRTVYKKELLKVKKALLRFIVTCNQYSIFPINWTINWSMASLRFLVSCKPSFKFKLLRLNLCNNWNCVLGESFKHILNMLEEFASNCIVNMMFQKYILHISIMGSSYFCDLSWSFSSQIALQKFVKYKI